MPRRRGALHFHQEPRARPAAAPRAGCAWSARSRWRRTRAAVSPLPAACARRSRPARQPLVASTNASSVRPAAPEREQLHRPPSALGEARRQPRGPQQRAGVERHRLILRLRAAPVEQRPQPLGIVARIAALQRVQRHPLEPCLLGRQHDFLQLAARQPDRPRLGVQRDLVEPAAMHHQRPLDAQRLEHLRDPPQHLGVRHAQQLHRRPRRVHAGAEQVHHRPHAQLPAHDRGMLHSRMVGGREEEGEAGLVQHRPCPCRVELDPRAQRFEHVGRSALARYRAIAMLGDLEARRRRDEARRGRDVDRPRPVSARPAAVGEQARPAARTAPPPPAAPAPRRSSPRASRPSSSAQSASRRSRRAPAGPAPAARTGAGCRRRSDPRPPAGAAAGWARGRHRPAGPTGMTAV